MHAASWVHVRHMQHGCYRVQRTDFVTAHWKETMYSIYPRTKDMGAHGRRRRRALLLPQPPHPQPHSKLAVPCSFGVALITFTSSSRSAAAQSGKQKAQQTWNNRREVHRWKLQEKNRNFWGFLMNAFKSGLPRFKPRLAVDTSLQEEF